MDHLLELRDASHVSLGKFSKNKTTRKDNEDSALFKINLTIFDGDVTKWEEFRDLFKSLVHDVDRIPPIKKMQYLKGYLTEEATEVIAKMKITAEGYCSAWIKML